MECSWLTLRTLVFVNGSGKICGTLRWKTVTSTQLDASRPSLVPQDDQAETRQKSLIKRMVSAEFCIGMK